MTTSASKPELKISVERTLRELGFEYKESVWQRKGVRDEVERAELRRVRDGWVFDTFSDSSRG